MDPPEPCLICDIGNLHFKVCSDLFVYGTLKSSFRGNRYARMLARSAELIGRAQTPGRLYGFRRYPGLRPALAPDQIVHGELHRLRRPDLLLPLLDDYETEEYRRILVPVTLAGAETRLHAWTYQLIHAPARHRRLRSGRWPEGPLPHLLRFQKPANR